MGFAFFADDARPQPAAKPARLDKLPGEEDKPKPEEETGDLEAGELVEPAGVGREVVDSLEVMLPWLTSLMVHLGLIILTLTVTWGVVQALSTEEDKVIIPSARLSDRPGGSTLSQSNDFELQQTQSLVKNVESESIATSGDAAGALDTNIGSGGDLQLIGVSGGGAGSAGKLAPFGTTTGAGKTGLGAKFYGTG